MRSYCDARRVHVGRTVVLPGGRVMTISGIGSDGRAYSDDGPGSVDLDTLSRSRYAESWERSRGLETDH